MSDDPRLEKWIEARRDEPVPEGFAAAVLSRIAKVPAAAEPKAAPSWLYRRHAAALVAVAVAGVGLLRVAPLVLYILLTPGKGY